MQTSREARRHVKTKKLRNWSREFASIVSAQRGEVVSELSISRASLWRNMQRERCASSNFPPVFPCHMNPIQWAAASWAQATKLLLGRRLPDCSGCKTWSFSEDNQEIGAICKKFEAWWDPFKEVWHRSKKEVWPERSEDHPGSVYAHLSCHLGFVSFTVAEKKMSPFPHWRKSWIKQIHLSTNDKYKIFMPRNTFQKKS